MVYEEIQDPFRRLVRIMERLQEPGGCPWDIKQTHQSLKPYLIEEAYECLDAIDSGDDKALAEELGDVLLQVIFHSVLSARTGGVNGSGGFTIDDVSNIVAEKMVRRHPHVFGDLADVNTADDVLKNWEKLKAAERGSKSETEKIPGALDGVPKNLPALLRAYRIQEKAGTVGFDWDDVNPVLDKVSEEIRELKSALAAGDKVNAAEEFGDLIFSLVNVSRFLKIDAEEALRQTCNKFQKRFSQVEILAAKNGKSVQELPLETLDDYWNQAKKSEQPEENAE